MFAKASIDGSFLYERKIYMIIEELKITDKEYPQNLKEIYDPPKSIYVLGNKHLLNKTGIAIVGSRDATQYGKYISSKIARELSEKGINIISGLAIGIDEYAHIGALQQNKGKTIAVLGSGIDQLYPKQNIELARKIIRSGGCIISEYPIGTKPDKKNFPQRNRIISGISQGILVVEAGEKSGALITAEFGLEQGKEIFAIPGDITKKQSRGCNLLIRDGAKVVLSSQDILDEIII